MRFSVIVPVFDARRFIPMCLPTVVRAVHDHQAAELIVVDNGSTDGSYELLQREFGEAGRICRLPDVNIGRVRNHGAGLAAGDILAFLDADFSVPPDFLSRAERVFRDPEVAATGAHYVLPEDASRVERAWYSMHETPHDGFVHYIPSGDFMVRREAFDAVGGFSETLETGEDAEFCQRLRSKGYKIFESSGLAGVHHGNARTLGAFFRKEVWRGLGMFGTVGAGEVDKPTVMLFAFLGLLAAGVVGLTAGLARGHPVLGAGALFVCAMAAPIATAIYRWTRTGKVLYPLLSPVLYLAYYTARARALVTILAGPVRGPGRRRVPGSTATPEREP